MDTLTKHVQKIAIYVHVIRIWASHGHENPACPEQIENPELSRRGRRAAHPISVLLVLFVQLVPLQNCPCSCLFTLSPVEGLASVSCIPWPAIAPPSVGRRRRLSSAFRSPLTAYGSPNYGFIGFIGSIPEH